MLNLISAAILMHAGSFDCNDDGIPDQFQTCLDCDDNGLLDPCEFNAPSGLAGQYWLSLDGDGTYSERLLTRIDPTIAFEWGNDSPDPVLPDDNFSARWTGTITPPTSGTYTFWTKTDDGVRLWVDGEQLINQWSNQAPTTYSATISLQAATPVLIRMDYYEAGGGAVAQLEWRPPTLEREIVPTSALSPSTDLDGDGWPEACTDCDGDGIVDAQALLDQTEFDCNFNCVPDSCDAAGFAPLGYWRFEEESGIYMDSGSNGLIATGSNTSRTPEVPTDPVPQTNAPNGLAVRSGGTGYVQIPDPTGLLAMAGQSITVEAWVKLDTLSDTSGNGQRQFLMQKKPLASSGAASDYSIMAQAANIQGSVSANYGKQTNFTGRELAVLIGTGSSAWTVTSHLEITDTNWHHVSVSYDQNTFEFRFGLDTEFESIIGAGLGFNNSGGPVVVGAHTNNTGAFNQFLRGDFDEFRISPLALPTGLLLNNFGTADCNQNGFPDACDIAEGFSFDCDNNGRPDECDPDCNGNGISDGCDIDFGQSQDCDQNNIPDECQLDEDDCNNNGEIDSCEIENFDCNENGLIDSCEIADGISSDCNNDAIPDDCQLDEQVVLSIDDGAPEYGIRSNEQNMAWLNRFRCPPGGATIQGIECYFNLIPAGQTLQMLIWSDPNGDGRPDDAQVIWSGLRTAEGNDVVTRYNVPDISVGQGGGNFFVGFITTATQSDFPAGLDRNGPVGGNPLPDCSWIVDSASSINPNNLSAVTGTNGFFGTIEDVLFPGNWVLRPVISTGEADCNLNGVPDACDIDDGVSIDQDGNGTPDECEDCNANGVLDSIDVDNQTSSDCDGDFIPDECQLIWNDCDQNGLPDSCAEQAEDCNNNGILDACDLATGDTDDANANGVPDLCEDCNNNGILDSDDVLSGASADCDGDLIPDECQLGLPIDPVPYAYDDGDSETNLGVVAPVDFVWLNRFVVQPGGEIITSIDIVYANTLANQPTEVVLWSDPDQNGDPSDAQVVTVIPSKTSSVNTDTFVSTPIPPTYMGPAGTSFFAGVHYNDVFNTAPIPMDFDNPAGESWLAWGEPLLGGDPIDLNDLANATVGIYQFSADNFLVRITGSDGTLAGDCNQNTRLDRCDILSGTSQDIDQNMVPDECECIGDFDSSGSVGFEDLLFILSSWDGPLGDLDGDGDTGFPDLLLLLSSFGPC